MSTIAADLTSVEFDPFEQKQKEGSFAAETTGSWSRYPKPHTEPELLAMIELGNKLQTFSSQGRDEQNTLLDMLEAYECFGQYETLIRWRIKNSSATATLLLEDFLCLMRTLYFGLERFDEFVDAACECATKVELTYLDIKMHIADGIIGDESWNEQAILYRKIAEKLSVPKEKVRVMERLALIYEKKLFLENEVEPIYSKIVNFDPFNVKARRFLKFVFMQSMKWKNAAEQLHAIMDGSQNEHERQRAAHELAQLYLYNLNDAAMSVELLKRHCANSTLDIRQTLLEAQERLGNFSELMETLQDLEKICTDSTELAGIKYKQGTVSLKAGNPGLAAEQLREAIDHNPQLLVAYESLIIALIDSGKPLGISSVLEMLEKEVNLPGSKSALSLVIEKAASLKSSLAKIQTQKRG